MFSSYKRVFWLAAIMTLFIYAPFHTRLFSTDVWARMSRIMEWANAGFPFKEQLVMGQNYPFGFELHWTRPLDFIGYAFAWPFIPGWGLKEALEMMACFVPILVMLVAVRGFFFALRGYASPKTAFFAFWLFFYGMGYSWGQASIGYFDHHCFHFAALVWSIALVARSFRVRDNRGYLIAAGIVSAFGTWLTPEFFINTYLLLIPFGFGWLWYNRSLKPAFIYTISYTVALALAMSFDHPIAGFGRLDFARTSLLHVLFGVFNSVLLGFLSIPLLRKSRLRRLIYGVLGLGILGTVLLFGFTDELLTPMVDPMMYYIWTSKVSEMRPLWENWKELFVYAILPGLLAVGFIVWCLCHGRNRWWPLAMISAGGTLFYVILMIFHVRVGISQNAYFIFLGACYLGLTFFPREKSFRQSLIFILFYLLLIGGALKGTEILYQFKAWGVREYLARYKNDPNLNIPDFLKEPFDKAIQEEKEENEEGLVATDKNQGNEDKEKTEKDSFECYGREKDWQVIRDSGATGSIFTDIFEAPQLNWETGRPVFSGPYDRNIEGIMDSVIIHLDRPPFDRAKALLEKHQVSQLYMRHPNCLPFLFADNKTNKMLSGLEDTFHFAVYHQTEQMPDWLRLEYEDPKTHVKIFRMKDPKSAQK